MLELPSHILFGWIAYIQIENGTFKPVKTQDEIDSEELAKFERILGL